MIDTTAALIAPYVEQDPTKFYTYEEFETGVATLREFCLLRKQSVLGQLDGTIPATTSGQSADSSALIDASHLTTSDMGTMNMGGGGFGGDRGGMDFGTGNFGQNTDIANGSTQNTQPTMPNGGTIPSMPTDGAFIPSMPGGADTQTVPTDTAEAGASMPGDMTMPEGMTMPDGLDRTNIPGGSSTTSSLSSIVLLAASVVILAAGLLFAFKFKR